MVEFGCGNGANLARVPHATERLGVEIVPTYPIPREGVNYQNRGCCVHWAAVLLKLDSLRSGASN